MPSDHHQIYQPFADSGLCRKRLGSWNQLFSDGLVRRMKAHLENEDFQHVPQQVSCQCTCWWQMTCDMIIADPSCIRRRCQPHLWKLLHPNPFQDEQPKKTWSKSIQKKIIDQKTHWLNMAGSLSHFSKPKYIKNTALLYDFYEVLLVAALLEQTMHVLRRASHGRHGPRSENTLSQQVSEQRSQTNWRKCLCCHIYVFSCYMQSFIYVVVYISMESLWLVTFLSCFQQSKGTHCWVREQIGQDRQGRGWQKRQRHNFPKARLGWILDSLLFIWIPIKDRLLSKAYQMAYTSWGSARAVFNASITAPFSFAANSRQRFPFPWRRHWKRTLDDPGTTNMHLLDENWKKKTKSHQFKQDQSE